MLYTFASKRLSLIVHDTKSKEGGNFIRKDYLFKLGLAVDDHESRFSLNGAVGYPLWS